MIRSVIAYVLIITLLVSNSTRFVVYAGFKLNQGFIASVLCENRDKPVLKCQGKCYLTKKLKQAEEKEKGKEGSAQKNRFQEALISESLKFNFPLRLISILQPFVLNSSLSGHTCVLFHPPNGKPLS